MAAENMYLSLSASQLSAIILKGTQMSKLLEREHDFGSEVSENGDDCGSHSIRDDPSSPTDTSEDSVEVNPTRIMTPAHLKRKHTFQPSPSMTKQHTLPFRKRIKKEHCDITTEPLPITSPQLPLQLEQSPADVIKRHPGLTTWHRPETFTSPKTMRASSPVPSTSPTKDISYQDEPIALLVKKEPSPTNVQHTENGQHYNNNEQEVSPSMSYCDVAAASSTRTAQNQSVSDEECRVGSEAYLGDKYEQKNYKNMTRERRIEANARERTRVHTISAAFETLRHSIPSYSNTQKLSKLSVLRIACSYIMTLGKIAGCEEDDESKLTSLTDCVEGITRTIQTEGKIRKKKDE